MEFMIHGAGPVAQDAALFLLRFTMGLFFVVYRFRWVWDPSDCTKQWCPPARRDRLIKRLEDCGYGYHPILAGSVAVIEILAGLGLMAGLLTIPSAVGIFVIMLFANCCTPREEIPLMRPVDKVDVVRCYLHLAEPLYAVMALSVVLMGPGRWSMDYVIWRVMQ